ncbi:hypothetical protein DY000_02059318 [Brassica cretica]|uniref:DUF4283 domain-containing protein n=1 Tax=Brassica cretica TaxID=69181 RepID=A0ABQ7B3L9_BRACR|nr:hypothetical protein DY000_02059318 [Brassica cretica]
MEILGRFEVIRGKGELGKIRIIAKLISISVIIKTKFPDNKGITYDYFTHYDFLLFGKNRENQSRIWFHWGMENWDPLWNWADQVLRQEWTSNVVIMEWRIRLQRYGILVYRLKDMTIIDDLMKLRDYTLYEDQGYVLFFWSKWENGVFIGAADAMATFGLFKPNTV